MYLKLKRFIDTVLALFLLIITTPLLLIISIAVKLESPGPVLFRQYRTGLNGKEFELFKFRSMDVNNNVMDFNKEDQLTKVGRILRKTSLDELPQFYNILKGDMSFVGPRPWITICYEYFTPDQKKRNLVRPGITGIAQVSGRKNLNIIERINYDLEYVNKISLLLDIKIIFKTVVVIFNSSDNTHKNYTVKDELEDLIKNHENYLYKERKHYEK